MNPTSNQSSVLKVLITGGSRGIGKEIAQLLRSTNSYQVFTPTRNDLDLLNTESIQHYFNEPEHRKVDILINNAGINVLANLEQIDLKGQWPEMIQTNLTAPLYLIQQVIPHMKAQQWGRILNISSIFSQITKDRRAAYSAVKAGLNGLTRTAAVELGPYSILVNALCPGYVETDLTYQNNTKEALEQICQQIPVRRMAQPLEIATYAEFLVSAKNSYITGQSLVIDGGFSLY